MCRHNQKIALINEYIMDISSTKLDHIVASTLELVSKELNHLASISHVYAGGLIFMK